MCMGQLLYVGAALLILAALMLLAQGAAGLMTKPIDCTGRTRLNFKPFNCTACLTFWFTLALLFGALACFGYDWPASRLITQHYGALCFAFINYFYIKTKIEVYE